MQQAAAPSEDGNDVNLTPMLDVVFIMLIFFIVTATFVQETGIDVNQSNTIDSNPSPSEVILIRIAENNEIRIGSRWIDQRSVRAHITRLHTENPDAQVVVQAHKASKTDTLMQVMDASRQAGVYDFALAAAENAPIR